MIRVPQETIFTFQHAMYALVRFERDRWIVWRARRRGRAWYRVEPVTDFDAHLIVRLMGAEKATALSKTME